MGFTDAIIDLAIKEDLPSGDLTTDSLVPDSHRSVALITAKEDMVVCGLEIAKMVFSKIDGGLEVDSLAKDGDRVEAGADVLEIKGKTASILKAERIALNFLQRLSGISTTTRAFVDRVKKYGVKIWDTRKTTPAYRELEKMAVKVGGGKNHRMSLSDAVLIKDNHIKAHGSVYNAVKKARAFAPAGVKIEVEVRTSEELKEAPVACPDIIMLDNMTPAQVRKAVEIIRKDNKDVIIEVSGGITLDNIEEFAKAGLNAISVGALTHSVKAADLSLNLR